MKKFPPVLLLQKNDMISYQKLCYFPLFSLDFLVYF